MSDDARVLKYQSLLVPADIFRVVCVDERKVVEKNLTNPVNLPGATYCIVDALKSLYKYSEEAAWKAVYEVRIPLGSHTDDHIFEGQESSGCGYASLVETNHKSVLAKESVKSINRIIEISRRGGEILHYVGSHLAKEAVINYRQGTSIDQDQLPKVGLFSCDVWASHLYATYLNQYDDKVNPQEFMVHIEKVFIATVKTLTNSKVNSFIRIY